MTWPKIVLLAWFALGALMTVATVGKQKKPTTPGTAAVSLVLVGLVAWLVVIA
ncbi:hypothetical protein GCM10025864_39350 [Luteimicrobium album]|uniref:Uncharacterized protein n=1 Tax=Luteimicrobium album TaxID=1054550 RepID=A0ABQ6I7A8_9MICO|nr:hypothetical protein [Luteimicrobium album]GMA26176.1 hypothetical protein GCM10025864_39350 [Luteimicrobium album]